MDVLLTHNFRGFFARRGNIKLKAISLTFVETSIQNAVEKR